MSLIYSKSRDSEATSEANNQNTNPKPDQLDIDLIDIIKTVIPKLKTNDDGHSIQKKRYAIFPCAMCDKNCNNNQHEIFCTSCSNWVHRKCNGTTKTEYVRLSQEPEDLPFTVCYLLRNKTPDSFHCSF